MKFILKDTYWKMDLISYQPSVQLRLIESPGLHSKDSYPSFSENFVFLSHLSNTLS